MPLPPIDSLFAIPPAHAGTGAVLVRSIRLWALLARQRRSPRASLEPLLGLAERPFAGFMEEVVSHWPDPIMVLPPCAGRLSPDESALTGLLAASAAGDRAAADALLKDLLPPQARDRLYAAASRVMALL
jgi:hypothetical protein